MNIIIITVRKYSFSKLLNTIYSFSNQLAHWGLSYTHKVLTWTTYSIDHCSCHSSVVTFNYVSCSRLGYTQNIWYLMMWHSGSMHTNSLPFDVVTHSYMSHVDHSVCSNDQLELKRCRARGLRSHVAGKEAVNSERTICVPYQTDTKEHSCAHNVKVSVFRIYSN